MNPLKKQKEIMKTKNMIWAALSMTAALVMTACTNDDNAVETPAAPQAEVKTIPYSVTVSQGGNATTRATVDDDMKTLRFAAGDKLYIDSGDRDDLKGILTLKADDEGKSSGATFEGTISYTGDAPTDGIPLNATLVGTSNVNIVIEDGKVTGGISPSAYYDNVKEAVEEYSYLTSMSTYGEKEFTLVQIMAFLNFEITFEDGTASGTTLTTVVSNGDGPDPYPYCSADVTTKTEGEKVVAKFVLPVAKGTTLSGATVKMGDKAALTINDATLEGKVYNVKRTYAAAAPAATLLSTIASDYTAQDGETLTGTLGSNVKISIADGATVTLKDVTINGVNSDDYEWAGITCLGDATIILSGTNTVKGFKGDYPGIQAAAGNTLIINGTGSLTASSYGWGAGIGGGSGVACGNIEIQGGTITATSGERGAGIGGGNNASWGNITISGGTVTATGGERGAGIGGGRKGLSDVSCGNIYISGGTVNATGGAEAAGIGGGRGYNSSYQSSCGTITITTGVTKVTATKGSGAPNSIGAGNLGTCGTVTIEAGANVTQN